MEEKTTSPEMVEMKLCADSKENTEDLNESSSKVSEEKDAAIAPNLQRRASPASLAARLSDRRREISGLEHVKPLTVKIINPAFHAEAKPLIFKDRSFPAPSSAAAILSGKFLHNNLSNLNASDAVSNPSGLRTPGGDTLASGGSGLTPSGRRAARKRFTHDEEERKKRTIDRLTIATAGIKSNVANWFGVGDEDDDARRHTLNRWRSHVERVHTNSSILGGYRKRADTLESVFEHSSGQPSPAVFPKTPQPYDPLARGHRMPARQFSRISQVSISRRSGRVQPTKKADKDPVWKMAYDGVKGLVMPPPKLQRKPSVHSRSIMPNQLRECQVPTPTPTINSVFHSEESSFLDDVFFDSATPTSAVPPAAFHATVVANVLPQPVDMYSLMSSYSPQRPVKAGWHLGRSPPEPALADTPSLDRLNHHPFQGMERINGQMVKDILSKPDKRQIGKGFAGFLTDAEYRKSRLDSDIRLQMAEMDDHRLCVTSSQFLYTSCQQLVFRRQRSKDRL